MSRRAWGTVAVVLIPAIVGAVLRLSMIGGPPFTDAGTYHYNTWLAREVGGSLPIAPLNGYAWLCSWLGADADAPYFRVRVFDALIGGVAAGVFAWLLRRFAGGCAACVFGVLWAILAASPLINDAGYKNPLSAAWIPIFMALRFATQPGRSGSMRAGVCVAIACCLREALAPSALLVPAVVLVRRGVPQTGRCLLGGVLGGAGVLTWMFAVGIYPIAAFENLLAMSTNASELLRVTGGDPAAIRAEYFRWMIDFCGFLAWPALVGVVSLVFWHRQRLRLAAPVLALALMPLPEIFGKFCLPYHWFQLAPAALLLGAIGWRRLVVLCRHKRSWRVVHALTWGVLMAAVWLGSTRVRNNIVAGFALHEEFRGVMIDGDWSDPAVARSRYLSIAAWLRATTPVGASVLVSGYAYGIYVLAGRRPASIEVSDLTFSRMTGQRRSHPEWFDELRENPPDVILETDRWPEPLDSIWPGFDRDYQLARTWGKDPAVHYGTFGMRAWSRAR